MIPGRIVWSDTVTSLRIVDVWDYYTTTQGTRVMVGIDEHGCVVTVPLAFVEVTA